MKKFRMLKKILVINGINKFLISFIIYFIVTALIVFAVEPNINSFFDSIWFCFVSVATIGYGDFVSVTVVGKIAIMLLVIYGMLMISIITGTAVNFFSELQKIKLKESTVDLLDKLEHLDVLSKEELKEISKTISKLKKNIKSK